MKKCPKCGKEVMDNINVCTACGAKITESKVKVEKKEAAPALRCYHGDFSHSRHLPDSKCMVTFRSVGVFCGLWDGIIRN